MSYPVFVCPPARNVPTPPGLFAVRFYLYYLLALLFSTKIYVQYLMRFVTGHLLRGEGGVQYETNGGQRTTKHFFPPTTYVSSCHYSADAPYTFGHNHRKQYAKSSNEALKRTVYHTYVWLKLCTCNRHFI
jgi:hypothetical protein